MINNKISSSQLAVLSFLMFMAPLAFIRSDDLNNNIADSVFSFITVVLITLLLSIPLFMKNVIIVENKFISLLYSLYFVFIIVTDITAVTKMLTNTVIPDGNGIFIALSTLLIAIYGAVKGTEAVGRGADIIFPFFLLGAFFIILSALQIIRPEEYVIPFENGYEDYFDNTVLILSAVSFIPMTIILKENSNGKFTIKYIIFITAALIIGLIFLLETQFCLGYYALTQQYPIYTLSAVTKAEPLKRLDLIFTVIFLMASVIRMSVSVLCLFKLAGKYSKRHTGALRIASLFFTAALTVLFLCFEETIGFQLTVYLRAAMLFIFSLPIPLIIKLINKGRAAK